MDSWEIRAGQRIRAYGKEYVVTRFSGKSWLIIDERGKTYRLGPSRFAEITLVQDAKKNIAEIVDANGIMNMLLEKKGGISKLRDFLTDTLQATVSIERSSPDGLLFKVTKI
jgi:hypothetical protein